MYHPLPKIKFETKIQTGAFPYVSDLGDTIASAEYLGTSSTISLAAYNAKRETGRMTIGFLKSFNESLCAGAELLAEWKQRNQVQTNVALAARYVAIFLFFIFFFGFHIRHYLVLRHPISQCFRCLQKPIAFKWLDSFLCALNKQTFSFLFPILCSHCEQIFNEKKYYRGFSFKGRIGCKLLASAQQAFSNRCIINFK